MKKGLVVAGVVLVLALATVGVLWPRTKPVSIRFQNMTGMRVRLTVERLSPRETLWQQVVPVAQFRYVTWRYTSEELAAAGEHVVSVAVDDTEGKAITSGRFTGAQIYDKLLVLRPSGIEITDR